MLRIIGLSLCGIQRKANKADILVGVCYRPLNQDEETEETFCEQLVEVTQLLALVLMGHFNLPDNCWKYNPAERKQSRTVWKITSTHS